MKVLMSIKPEYAEKIFNGEKTFEFRRSIFKNEDVKTVVVYASAPVKKVIGEFEVLEVLNYEVEKLWFYTGGTYLNGISKEKLEKYFEGKERGFAIKIGSVREYLYPKKLKHFGLKRPPQSFCYLKDGDKII